MEGGVKTFFKNGWRGFKTFSKKGGVEMEDRKMGEEVDDRKKRVEGVEIHGRRPGVTVYLTYFCEIHF